MKKHLTRLAEMISLNIQYGYYSIISIKKSGDWHQFNIEIDDEIFKISIRNESVNDRYNVLLHDLTFVENYMTDEDFHKIKMQLESELQTA